MMSLKFKPLFERTKPEKTTKPSVSIAKRIKLLWLESLFVRDHRFIEEVPQLSLPVSTGEML